MSVVKGKIFRGDIEHWDGITKTASRKDQTGGTTAGLVLGHEVDVLQVYGNGENYTWQTITDCINRIGSSTNVTLLFNPGTWVIDQDLTIGSNFTCRVPNGVVFSVSSGKTLTFSGAVIRDGSTWTSGSGTVTESGTRTFTGLIDLSGAVLQGGTPLVFEGSTANAYETSFVITNPTADRTVTFPDADLDFSTLPTLAGNNTWSGINTFSAGIGPAYMQNFRISASVASNNLTVSVLGNDGNALSSTNIASVSIRSTTLTSGAYNVRQLTSATSVVLPGTGTLGFAASNIGHIYVFLCDDGSSRELGLCAIYKDEGQRFSTSAIGTGSDSGTTIYTTNALTNAAIRWVGRIQIQIDGSTNWTNAASIVETWNPDLKKTGDVIQHLVTTDTTNRTIASTFTTFATSSITQAVTPTRASSFLELSAFGTLGIGSVGIAYVAFHDGSSTLIPSGNTEGLGQRIADSSSTATLAMYRYYSPQVSSALTIGIYGCTDGGQNLLIGKRSADTTIDSPTFLIVKEICA